MTGPHPDPDDLVLAALPAEPDDPVVAAHLTGCAACTEVVEEYRRTVASARTGAADLPVEGFTFLAGTRASVLREITDDPPPVDGPSVVPARTGVGGSRRRWWWMAGAAAAALVLLAAGLGIGIAVSERTGAAPATRTLAQLQPIGVVGPGVGGSVGMVESSEGWVVVVHLTRVASPQGTDFLEVWLMDATGGDMVALGALAQHGDDYDGSFTVPSNLPMDRLQTVDISAERYDGNPAHSGISLLRGNIT